MALYQSGTGITASVGIGTTNPSDILHLQGTSTPSIRIDAGAGGTTDPRIHFYSGSTFRGRVAYSYGGSYMYFQNDTQDKMRFNNGAGGSVIIQPTAGNVGIGISPTYKLDVSGDIRVSGNWYWAPGANYFLDGTANNQEWSFDLRNNGTYTGLRFDVWSDTIGSILSVVGNTGRVGVRNTGPTWMLDVAGDIRATGQTSQFNRIRPYSSSYGSGYDTAAIEVREYNLEGAAGGTENARAPRIGFHWAGRVASEIIMEASGRIGIWNNPGNAFEQFASGTYYCSGSVGIRLSPSYAFDCAGGQGYFIQTRQSGYGWNRFTGYPNEDFRSQVILQSYYSDLIVCSSEINGTHGSTISMTTNSTANNDYRKFVINVGNWSSYGTGGYGDRMSFGWKDGAYASPHTYVTPDDSVMCLWGRNKCVGINNVGSPGYNLHVNGSGYFSTQCYVGDWFRVYGSGGLYFETHGGGWQMTDSTWIRSYNGKAIYTTGTIATTGDVIAYYSDMRLKKNIKPIEDALEKLMGLSTFTYEANDVAESLGYKANERNVGFSAQEVKEILPEVIRLAPCDIGDTNEVTNVTESKTGENYMTLLYERMLPLVVKAVQEESTARRELAARVEALEKLLVKE